MIYLENSIKQFENVCGKNSGIFYMVLQSIMFSTMGVFIKSSKPMQSFEVAFYRSILMFSANFFILKHYKINPYRSPKDKFFLLFISRAVIGFTGMASFFYALSISSIAEVTSVFFLSPGDK